MAENVGQMLASHASALDAAVGSLIKTAIVSDNFSKDMAIERTRKVLAFPPTRMAQHILYQSPGADGNPEYRIIKFNLLVPTFIMINNEPIVISKYTIKSTFEAMIKKSTGVESETGVNVSGKAGFLGIPSVGFDISEKLTVNHNSESSQHNTFDVEVEMSQGQPSVGYIEIVKAFVRCVNQVVDFICNNGLENPAPITDDEAQKLQDEADVPVTEVDTTKNGNGNGNGGAAPAEPAQEAA